MLAWKGGVQFMSIQINTKQRGVLAYKTVKQDLKEEKSKETVVYKSTDQVVISNAARENQKAEEDYFTKLESGFMNGDFEIMLELSKENNKLEVNWQEIVDPNGKIYGAAFVESLVTQYQVAETKIKEFYSKGHEENMSYENPYGHLCQKYSGLFSEENPNLVSDNPYFRYDMEEAERAMAFRQEYALLNGKRVIIGDPYALKESGGMLNIKEVDAIAKQAAKEKIEELIKQRKEELK